MYIFLGLFSLIVFFLIGSSNNCGPVELHKVKFINTQGSCWIRGILTSTSFIIGGLTSMLSGYIGMRIAVFSNVRTTIGARNSWTQGFETAFRGGSIIGFSLVSLALSVLYICISLFHINVDLSILGNAQTLFECIAGYGLGGSSIALFGRVGGGIYTKNNI